MAFRTSLRILVAAFGVAALCQAQSAPPAPAPCPDANQAGSKSASARPCTPSAPKANAPSAAQQFPFPGEASQPDQTPSAPDASHPSAAAAHPYPGNSGADAGSSSSSSSSGSSSSDDGDVPSIPPGDLGKLTRRKPAPIEKVQTKDQRVDEDLRVAKFYMNDDDLPGAYLRAKDAVRVEPDYSETHFMLGQVAQKMKKNEEAIAEYEAYLKMDPGGDRTKEVTRALEKLKK